MTGSRAGRPRDRGSMAVEVVVLVPLLFLFVLLIVAGGRLVQRQADVDSAARDAARAASIARSPGAAAAAADRAVRQSISTAACAPVSLAGTDFVAGGQVTVSLTCNVTLSDLGLTGLPGSASVRGESVAPLDVYRRAQ